MARQDQANDVFSLTSFLYGGNAAYIEDLYARYKDDPSSVDGEWKTFFDGLKDDSADVKKNAAGASWKAKGWPVAANGELVSALDGDWGSVEKHITGKLQAKAANGATGLSEKEILQATRDSVRAIMMIRAYRMRGHLHANLDPLGIAKPLEDYNELSPEAYGFSEADYDRRIFIDHVLGLEFATIREMLAILKRTYCSTLGVEFMHISDPAEKAWIQERIEGPDKGIAFTENGKRAILHKLIEAEGFEKFIDVKYKGTKRFGLDGGESLIPALEQIIKRGGALGVKDVVFGMAHRGRLNVLSQVMQKPHRAIFHEFKGGSFAPDDVEGSGDVKYHLGASSDREFDGNRVHLSLTANPSHLEAVDPVVLGKARSKQDRIGSDDVETPRTNVLPLLLHGDAAFAGQGVVAECFGFSGLRGYRTGGTIHFIVNNQIGFTTAPKFSRSSPYPSDVAKMVAAPIFHVNGDDPEAVVYAAKVATEFRQKFGWDVVIDMFCYRRFGHNEGDEPSFTQPVMYKKIRAHPTTRAIYAERLETEGVIAATYSEDERNRFKTFLEDEFKAADAFKPNKADWLDGQWSGFVPPMDDDRRGDTAVDLETLTRIGERITSHPDGFKIHKTLARVLGDRRGAVIEKQAEIDWATAEALAFGSLVLDGFGVRLSGQDSRRGTFSQRHAVFIDQETEKTFTPLNHLKGATATFEVHDSSLSEFAVLGFEYGYSLANPKFLVLWEAQFGDFSNGAQIIFDQFLSSGERKWLRMSGLVCLLPHGYEGQGPEHSSARLERFLQLCAQDNMQVANCTTPANYFHILRRQMRRNFRKPLILMTPKSLLRHKRATSMLKEMGPGSSFHRVLWDDAEYKPGSTVQLQPDDKIKRVVMCSGKVYYDLLEEREKRGIDNIYLLRVEQFYPFPAHSMLAELQRFKKAEMVWCQEEPKNMGAWTFMDPNIEWTLDQIGAKAKRARYAGRPAAASPATGLMSRHKKELDDFLNEALTL